MDFSVKDLTKQNIIDMLVKIGGYMKITCEHDIEQFIKNLKPDRLVIVNRERDDVRIGILPKITHLGGVHFLDLFDFEHQLVKPLMPISHVISMESISRFDLATMIKKQPSSDTFFDE